MTVKINEQHNTEDNTMTVEINDMVFNRQATISAPKWLLNQIAYTYCKAATYAKDEGYELTSENYNKKAEAIYNALEASGYYND